MSTRASREELHLSFLASVRARGGVVSRATALSTLGRRGFDRLRAETRLIRVLPGLYAPADVAGDHRVRCRSVWLWSRGRALIAGASALHLHDPRVAAPARVHAIAPVGHQPLRAPWADLRLTATPERNSRVDGIGALAPADAVVDAWSRAAPDERKGLLYEALWHEFASAQAVVSATLRRRRVPQRQVIDRILRNFLDGATSPTEVLAKREVLTGAAFADLEWQVRLTIRGRTRYADALHREARVVVELDGDRYHSTRAQREADRERDADFAAEGWQTVRLGYSDLRDRPRWCRETVAAVIGGRLAGRRDHQHR